VDVKYLTPTEVAEELRVTPEAVQTWCRQGRLKALRAGRRWLITRAAVDDFIRQGVPLEQGPKVDGLAAFAN